MSDEIKSDPANTGLIYTLIPKAMAEVGHIAKTRQAGQGGNDRGPSYKFRGIDDVYKAIQPVFATLGMFCAPSVIDQKREERSSAAGKAIIYTILTVRHRFYATDGSFVDVVTVGEAMDSSDKSSNKAMSAAMKYAALELLSIPTEEDNDTENAHHEVKSRAAMEQERAQELAGTIAQEMKAALTRAYLDELAQQARALPEDLRKPLRTLYVDRLAKVTAAPGALAVKVADITVKPDPFAVIDNAPPPAPPSSADEDAVMVEVASLIKLLPSITRKADMGKLLKRWVALPFDDQQVVLPHVQAAAKRLDYAFSPMPDTYPDDDVRF